MIADLHALHGPSSCIWRFIHTEIAWWRTLTRISQICGHSQWRYAYSKSSGTPPRHQSTILSLTWLPIAPQPHWVVCKIMLYKHHVLHQFLANLISSHQSRTKVVIAASIITISSHYLGSWNHGMMQIPHAVCLPSSAETEATAPAVGRSTGAKKPDDCRLGAISHRYMRHHAYFLRKSLALWGNDDSD